MGSEHDDRFTSTWQALRESPDLLARYNALKATTGGTPNHERLKSDFFTALSDGHRGRLIESGHRDTREITGADRGR